MHTIAAPSCTSLQAAVRLMHVSAACCSLTSTGLYKEIAKFGKAAAQPFKQVQVSLNDTFANLGSLSAVGPKLGVGGTSVGHSSSNSHASSPGAPRLPLGRLQPARRSQAGRLQREQGRLDANNNPDSFDSVISELQALQAGIKESTGLLRIDLQQHTALQVSLGTLLHPPLHSACVAGSMRTHAMQTAATIGCVKEMAHMLWVLQAAC